MKKSVFAFITVFILFVTLSFEGNSQVVNNQKEKSSVKVSVGMFINNSLFKAAKPIWPDGREKEMNLFVGFRTVFQASKEQPMTLRLTASSLYRVFVNGEFCGHGPARGPHDYYRVDEWDLAPFLKPGKNVIAIEVAGYNVNSYYLLDQPSFLQAEVVSENRVLVFTGETNTDFKAHILKERVQKVQRYSFQRTFTESYQLQPGYDQWRSDPGTAINEVTCKVQETKNVLVRGIPYPRFAKKRPVWEVAKGRVEQSKKLEKPWRDRALTKIGPAFKGYEQKDLEFITSDDVLKITTASTSEINQPLSMTRKIELAEKSFHIVDFGTNYTGFIGATITCQKQTQLYFTFDEILRDGDVDFKRLSIVSAVKYDLSPGTYQVESIEPYTLRYLKLIVVDGDCEVENLFLREYTNPDVWEAQFASSDKRLNKLFNAGRETYRQNAVDIFMDCPSRERAGWLCDSYFTSRVGFDLGGETAVEKNFFQNYLLPKQFAHLPAGMLPMCYPADHNDGVFIPNWALWFVLQLQEYQERGGDRDLVEALEPKVRDLFAYFEKFRNEDGLLENLESWVFVEWSKANDFVQDVNYPSNMLYASAMEAAGKMYILPEFISDAEKIRAVIKKQSWDGEFFVDNAKRIDGKLLVTNNRTEVCQYFAFYFNIATPESYPQLWEKLVKEFGPQRQEQNKYPDIYEANSFVGNVLRLEILSRYGFCQQVLDESIDYQLFMADRTGTLWENIDTRASCNHGFASHAIHSLYRDVLGIYNIDLPNKSIILRFTDLDLDWCEGRQPIGKDSLFLSWWRKNQELHYRVRIPAGFKLKVESTGDLKIVQHP